MQFKKRFSKWTAVFLVITQVMTPLPGRGITAPVSMPAQNPQKAIDPLSWKLPPDMGSVELRRKGTSGKTLLLIEDAHAARDAQENIYKILDQTIRSGETNTVLLEGLTVKPDLNIFRAFPDRAWLA